MNVIPHIEMVGPYKLTVNHLQYKGGRSDRWFWTCVDTRDTSRVRSNRSSDEAYAKHDARKAAATLERELEQTERAA